MTDTIVRNSTPTAPLTGLLFVSAADVGVPIENVLHPQLNGTGHTITYRPARKRSGTLELTFPTAAAAYAAVALLATAYTFTLTADISQTSMTFVVRPGELRPRQGKSGGRVWLIDVPVQEV